MRSIWSRFQRIDPTGDSLKMDPTPGGHDARSRVHVGRGRVS
jgi:hypothetical protein